MKRTTVIALVLAWATAAPAAVYRVPEDYGAIYEAVDAAAAGDSVLIGPGVWTERDTRVVSMVGPITKRAHAFLKPGLTIIGTAGSAATILQGDALDPSYASAIMVYPDNFTGGTIVIRGLTFRGLATSGGLVGYIAFHSTGNGSLEFEDCVLETSFTAMVVQRAQSVSLMMRSCVLRDNDSTWPEPVPSGIDCSGGGAEWNIEDCLFENNVGGRVLLNQGTVAQTTIRSCRFIGNEGGHVVRLYDQSPLVFEDNWFEGNVGPSNVSGTCVGATDCSGSIQGNTFVNNEQLGNGQGIILASGPTDVISNTLYGTVVPPGSSGAGVLLLSGSDVMHFHSNIIAGCRGGPAVLRGLGDYNPTDGCNVFWDNDSGDFSGYVPQLTDVHIDPMFCNAPNLDFSLSAFSPCLPGGIPTCDLIGAWGQGCGVISVSQRSWGEIKSLYRTEE